jgi:beta-carotene 15,15'-dioxygenase
VHEFEKLRKFVLAFGLLLTLIVQTVTIGDELQLYFLIFIVSLIGIPHGSLDFFIERQSLINNNQKISIRIFLAKYLFTMLAYGIVWWLFPTISLLAFIAMAAFHFGEIDWPVHSNTKLDSGLYTVYGFLLIAFILTSHIRSAAPILEIIIQKKLSAAFWLKWGDLLFPYCCLSVGLIILIISLLRTRLKWGKNILYKFILQSFVLVFIIYILPLYLSFGFYFGLWHSLLSFNLIRKQMKLTNDWSGWIFMAKKAIPYSIVAWMGILILAIMSGTIQTEWLLLSDIFVGVAILTLPHLWVFTKVNFASVQS